METKEDIIFMIKKIAEWNDIHGKDFEYATDKILKKWED